MIQTAERVSQHDQSDNYVFQRSILAYHKAAEIVNGKVLELGTGMGYGIEIVAPKCDEFVTLDKHLPGIPFEELENVRFLQQTFPPFSNVEDNYFDFVITFQVIEHIQDDHFFLKEIHRVLKPGGKVIVTTPNKPMSITRNPWHIREYFFNELKDLMLKYYSSVDDQGVFGDQVVQDYYIKNKESVKRITRFDIFNLQYNLPRWVLQVPYDILNRWNRKKLLIQNTQLTSGITMDNYSVSKAKEGCYDLFYIATK
ncbi:class I SAM-dependent methyltransferase [Bacteroidia bacterium]|nr:class I SAM-dependent methyltransferase [Bacteroidia bacterium]